MNVASDVFSPKMFFCPEGHDTERDDAGLAVLPEDANLIADPSTLFERDWWHASKSAELTLGPNKFTHVGSEDAARHRAVTFNASYDLFLYKISLNPEASVDSRVLLEFSPNLSLEDIFPMSLDTSPDITRYLNIREAPGSVSLILRPTTVVSLELVESFPKRA